MSGASGNRNHIKSCKFKYQVGSFAIGYGKNGFCEKPNSKSNVSNDAWSQMLGISYQAFPSENSQDLEIFEIPNISNSKCVFFGKEWKNMNHHLTL